MRPTNRKRQDIGRRIREQREKLEMTQGMLAYQLGLKQSTIATYEAGGCSIKVETLAELARVLKCHPGYFFGDFHSSQPVAQFLAGLEGAPRPLTPAEWEYLGETLQLILKREG